VPIDVYSVKDKLGQHLKLSLDDDNQA
jgi:hypothetical protein